MGALREGSMKMREMQSDWTLQTDTIQKNLFSENELTRYKPDRNDSLEGMSSKLEHGNLLYVWLGDKL